jgi:hypothetical protein
MVGHLRLVGNDVRAVEQRPDGPQYFWVITARLSGVGVNP